MAFSTNFEVVNKGNFVHLKEDFTLADSAGANVVTVNGTKIDSTDLQLGGKYVVVQMVITEVSAGDGGWSIKVQGSLDGVNNWFDLGEYDPDLDSTGLNGAAGGIDLVTTKRYAPFYRVTVYSDGTDTLDAAAAEVAVGVPV